jgi:hypothetical protein
MNMIFHVHIHIREYEYESNMAENLMFIFANMNIRASLNPIWKGSSASGGETTVGEPNSPRGKWWSRGTRLYGNRPKGGKFQWGRSGVPTPLDRRNRD